MGAGFQRQSVSFPPAMLADLKREALEREVPLSVIVREYIRAGSFSDNQGRLDLRREGGNDDGS